MKSRFQRQINRNVAQVRLYGLCHPHNTTDIVWKQYGVGLVQYPREDWPARLEKVPAIYRPVIRSRLIRDYGYSIEVKV